MGGDGGTGKTTFIKRHKDGEFQKIYIECWDTAGQELMGGLRDGYYIKSDCAIIMFDVTDRATYTHVPDWYRDLSRVCGNIPIVLCGNKVDVKDRKIRPKQVTFHRKKNFSQYYEISAKSNYNFEKPFLCIARKLLKDESLNIEEEPKLQNQDFDYETSLKQKNEFEWDEAQNAPLPDDVDDELLV